MRIVSLVPSLTEYLYALGLRNEVVGVTKFCVHPNEAKEQATIIGGTKNIKIEEIKLLQADIVIASKEENVKEQVEALEEFTEVFLTDIQNLHDAFMVMSSLAERLQTVHLAKPMLEEIYKMSQVPLIPINKRVLYLIWKNPYMTVGLDTFIHEMLEYAGFENCIERMRYPQLNKEDIQHINPDIIMLSSEPFPFKEEHLQELQEICPSAEIRLVDGEMFSWYGSRILSAKQYLTDLNNEYVETSTL